MKTNKIQHYTGNNSDGMITYEVIVIKVAIRYQSTIATDMQNKSEGGKPDKD